MSITSAFADTHLRFEDFSVKNVYNEAIAAPITRTVQDRARYKLLHQANKPNFAGHYFVKIISCGAGCAYGAILDVKTGKSWWLPYYVGCADPNYFNPVSYQLDSSLIVFRGHPDEKGSNGEYYYNFRDGKFVKIAEVPLPGIYPEEVYSNKP